MTPTYANGAEIRVGDRVTTDAWWRDRPARLVVERISRRADLKAKVADRVLVELPPVTLHCRIVGEDDPDRDVVLSLYPQDLTKEDR
jgi:hypothetical protein